MSGTIFDIDPDKLDPEQGLDGLDDDFDDGFEDDDFDFEDDAFEEDYDDTFYDEDDDLDLSNEPCGCFGGNF